MHSNSVTLFFITISMSLATHGEDSQRRPVEPSAKAHGEGQLFAEAAPPPCDLTGGVVPVRSAIVCGPAEELNKKLSQKYIETTEGTFQSPFSVSSTSTRSGQVGWCVTVSELKPASTVFCK